jgi:carbohydrate-selective porin OprB
MVWSQLLVKSARVKYSLTQRIYHQDKAYEQQPMNTPALYSFTAFS